MKDWATWIYIGALLWLVVCLGFGHRMGKVNLWELVTATAKDGKVRTDGRKLYECGAFLVMTLAFAYWAVIDRLTEWYALLYVGAWVAARSMRDREKRLNTKPDDTEATLPGGKR